MKTFKFRFTWVFQVHVTIRYQRRTKLQKRYRLIVEKRIKRERKENSYMHCMGLSTTCNTISKHSSCQIRNTESEDLLQAILTWRAEISHTVNTFHSCLNYWSCSYVINVHSICLWSKNFIWTSTKLEKKKYSLSKKKKWYDLHK